MPRQIALQHFGTGYRHELHFKPLIIINNKSAVGNNRKLLNYMLNMESPKNLISNSRPKATFLFMIALHCSNLFGHDKHLLHTEIDLYARQSSRRQRQHHGKRPFQYDFGLRCRFWWLMPQWLTHTLAHTHWHTDTFIADLEVNSFVSFLHHFGQHILRATATPTQRGVLCRSCRFLNTIENKLRESNKKHIEQGIKIGQKTTVTTAKL